MFSAEYDYKAYRRYYLKVLIPSSSLSYLPGESSISLYCFCPSLGCPSVISYDVVFESCFPPSVLNFVYSGATLKLLSAHVNGPGLGIYRSPKSRRTGPPFLIDPSHTIMGCDLLSRTGQIHRWLLKCPTGQHLASFLAYGGPSRPPYIHPSRALRAQT